MSHTATIRAALAQPQEGEVEECVKDLEVLGKADMKQGYIESARVMFHAARLLRATQSNDPGGWQERERVLSGESPAQSIRALVEEQANDDGLWFNAQTAPEAYLQQQLRLLHEVIERTTK